MIRRLAAAAFAVALVGCSGSVGSDRPSAETGSGSSGSMASSGAPGGASGSGESGSSTASTQRPPTVISVVVQPGTATGYVGALADVTELQCIAESGGWTASGRVANRTDKLVSYRIYVSLLDSDRRTRAVFQVDAARVASGTSQLWKGHVDVQGDGLQCVLRVERTDVA